MKSLQLNQTIIMVLQSLGLIAITLVIAFISTFIFKQLTLTWPIAIFLGVCLAYLMMLSIIANHVHPGLAKRIYRRHQIIGVLAMALAILGIANYHQVWLNWPHNILMTWPLALVGLSLWLYCFIKQ